MKLQISLLIASLSVAVVNAQEIAELAIRPWIYRPNSTFLYQFNDGQDIWDLAREYCLSQGGDLISIKDVDELNWVLSHYPIYPNRLEARDRPVLIGLSQSSGGSGWRWTDDQSSHDSNLLLWGVGEPSGVEDCAAFDAKERKLRDVACDTRLPYLPRIRFICKAELDAMLKRTLSESSRQQMKALIKPDKMRLCPSGFFMWKDSCYHITAGEVSWFEGKTYCEGKGATLTSIHNNDTTAFLQRLYDKNVPNPSLFGYWVGATDEVTEDNWAWLDGTKFDYVVWSESWLPYTQPSGGRTENCLAVATDSEYHDYPCEKKLPAICHRPTKFHKVGS